jgi:hypothetical protein
MGVLARANRGEYPCAEVDYGLLAASLFGILRNYRVRMALLIVLFGDGRR